MNTLINYFNEINLSGELSPSPEPDNPDPNLSTL